MKELSLMVKVKEAVEDKGQGQEVDTNEPNISNVDPLYRCIMKQVH